MDDQPAAPIAAESAPDTSSAPVTPSDRLARMSPVETAAWRKDGTVPGTEAPVASSQGDGDPGDDGDAGEDHSQAAEPSGAPVRVDPAASAAGKALNRQKQTAQQRINDLARDKYRLEGELKSLRDSLASRSAATVEVPPVAPPASAASTDPDEPKEEDFETYGAFVRATAKYETRLAQQADQADRAQQQAAQREQQTVSTFLARTEAFKAAHPDYLEVVSNPDVLAVAHPYMHRAIAESELGPAVAYYLGAHLEEARQLASAPTAAAFDRAFGKLEARLEAVTPPAAATAADVTPNHITRAPAPPVTLGSRPAEPADDVERAGARRDVGAYIRTMNAREAAARR